MSISVVGRRIRDRSKYRPGRGRDPRHRVTTCRFYEETEEICRHCLEVAIAVEEARRRRGEPYRLIFTQLNDPTDWSPVGVGTISGEEFQRMMDAARRKGSKNAD